MHQFEITVNFNDWTDGQVERLIELLAEVGDYDKRDALLNYLHPLREEIILEVGVDGKRRTVVEWVRDC